MTPLASEVKFLDGTVFSKKTVLIAARPLLMEDEEEGSRIFTYKEGQWLHTDVDMDVWCMCSTRKPVPTIYCIGKDGRIYVNRNGKPDQERIKDAGHEPEKFGYLSDACVVEGTPYVCGDSGQIYRRENSGWVHFDEGVLERGDPLKVVGLNSIDGISEQDIYACGRRAALFHYDGKAWKRLPPPTPVHLKAVCCVSAKEVYLAGNDGVLLKGFKETWEIVPTPPRTGNFSAVKKFQDKLYLASDRGLFEYDGKKVERVVTGLKPAPNAYRLDANDGVLWSFGTRNLCFFDGKAWTYVKHPDNSE